MDRPPRLVSAPLLDRTLLVRVLVVSTLMATAAFGFFELAQLRGLTLEQCRTVTVNTVVVVEVAYLFGCRSLRHPLWRIGLFTNKWVWVGAAAMLGAQLFFTYAPIMNRLFHTAPLPLIWWIYATLSGAVILAVTEAKKAFGARKRVKPRTASVSQRLT